MNNFDKFINYILNKKFNFGESIDLNINLINKKKIFFNYNIELINSVNENKKILFLDKVNKIENNIFFGELYFNYFIKKKIIFDKIYYNKKFENIIKKNNLKKKFSKSLINNYNDKIKEINSKILKIVVNKNNFINLKIGNVKFTIDMIKNNFNVVINSIKNLFNYNIIVKNIYLSTTMGKSFFI